jgi:thiosulfate dehydrogenase
MRAFATAIALALAFTACAPETAETRGQKAVRAPSFSDSQFNAFACTDCHAERAQDVGTRIYPGAVLEGTLSRSSWWGGEILGAFDAVQFCYDHFMAGDRLDPNADASQDLLAYLRLLDTQAPAAAREAVAFTLPNPIVDVLPADATRGAAVYRNACERCHGALHTGEGRLTEAATVVPEDTFREHGAQYGPACTRMVFIEKIRHGSFLGYAGRMPPFSNQVLSDAQLADLLAYIGVATDGVCTP